MNVRHIEFSAILVLLCATLQIARGGDLQNELYFHATFDGAPSAIVDGKETKPLKDGEFSYEEGPAGKAIVIGEDPLVYKEEDSFPLRQGTYAFWVRPHWMPEHDNHWIFKKWTGWDRRPINGMWCLSGGQPKAFTMGLTSGMKNGKRSGQTLAWQYIHEEGETEWTAGEWKHFAYTWGKNGVRFYVNGFLVDINDQCTPPDEHAGEFIFGGKHNYYAGKMSLDDARIYTRVLNRHEVRALFELGAENFRGAPPQRRGVLEEAVVAREFSKAYKALYEEGRKGITRTPIEFSVAARKHFEKFFASQTEYDPAEVKTMRARLEGILRNIIGIPQVKNPIVVDGKVTESEWRHAARVKNFWKYKSSQRVWRDTTVNLAYDDEYLYLGAILEEYPGDKVIATFKEHDGKIWKNDAIELFIQPRPSGKDDYFHFIINALGAAFDRKGPDVSWDSKMKIAAVYGEDDDAWRIELAIPFAELGIKSEPGSIFRANIARENVDKDIVAWKRKGVLEVSSWTPSSTRLNDPDTFGILILK